MSSSVFQHAAIVLYFQKAAEVIHSRSMVTDESMSCFSEIKGQQGLDQETACVRSKGRKG